MNVENINRLIDHLKRVPETAFNMDEWFERIVPADDPLLSEYTDSYQARPMWSDDYTINEIHPAWAAEVVAMQEGAGPDPYKCNTVACIAGHAALLEAAETRLKPSLDIEDTARNWLGLTEDQADDLFMPSHLPDGKHYEDVTSKIAVRVCEHFRDTGEVNWWVAFGLEKPVEEDGEGQ